MNIKPVTESIGLPAKDLKEYLMNEICEFLNAKSLENQLDEFHDIIFALKNLAFAHTGKHLEIDESIFENKIRGRLKTFAAESKKKPIFKHDSIKDMPVGVVHISFGNFKQPWSNFDSFKNGTEAEIAMLTDNEFKKEQEFTNHLILTFDDVDQLEYSFLTSGWNRLEKNCILCRIPDFIYKQAKENANFDEVNELLSLQTLAALRNLTISNKTIFHFHSWESGICIDSEEFRTILGTHRKLFSPYLTVSRLREFMKGNTKFESTLNQEEMDIASKYEEMLVKFCDFTIVESEKDKQYYAKIGHDKVKMHSYSLNTSYVVPANKPPEKN